jgi:hypothetical protein
MVTTRAEAAQYLKDAGGLKVVVFGADGHEVAAMFVQGSVRYDEEEATFLAVAEGGHTVGELSWMKRSVTTRTSTPLSSVPRNSIPLRQTDVALLHRANGGDGRAIRFNAKSVHDAVSVALPGVS